MILLFLFFGIASAAEWSIDLEYSINNFANSYPLGRIELQKQYDGNWTGFFTAKADNSLLTNLKSNLNSFYKVKAISSNQKNGVVTSFTKPCLLLKSKLFHHFWVAVDGDRQTLTSVTVFPDILAAGGEIQSHECTDADIPSAQSKLGGTVHVVNKGTLPTPDTQSFVQKMERERKARQHGADADNRSFLAKYWMYIVPVVLFMLISNAVNPEAGGGGEGQ